VPLTESLRRALAAYLRGATDAEASEQANAEVAETIGRRWLAERRQPAPKPRREVPALPAPPPQHPDGHGAEAHERAQEAAGVASLGRT
jgi:hypothetical protein